MNQNSIRTILIQSPGYPDQYPINQDCKWYFLASNSQDMKTTLMINFLGSVNLENEKKCTYDVLEVSEYSNRK